MPSLQNATLMITKFYLSLLFCFGLTSVLSAQSIATSVIAAQGQVFSSASHRLAFTTGEAMTETFQNSGTVLTQGFHQPKLVVTALTEPLADLVDISYWPNPTRDILHVKLPESSQEPQKLELFDLRGKFLQQKEVRPGETLEIDLTTYTAGIYFLRPTSPLSSQSASYKIQKLQ